MPITTDILILKLDFTVFPLRRLFSSHLLNPCLIGVHWKAENGDAVPVLLVSGDHQPLTCLEIVQNACFNKFFVLEPEKVDEETDSLIGLHKVLWGELKSH